jgi:hypothetical protein
MENIRLLEQLCRLQEFYTGGEREAMADEISNLRDQLLEVLESKFSLYAIKTQASVLDFEAVVSEHTKYVQFTTELKSQLQQVWWSSQFGSLFVCGT